MPSNGMILQETKTVFWPCSQMLKKAKSASGRIFLCESNSNDSFDMRMRIVVFQRKVFKRKVEDILDLRV
jgi:hypothetical protein